jgi:hypothetical protein
MGGGVQWSELPVDQDIVETRTPRKTVVILSERSREIIRLFEQLQEERKSRDRSQVVNVAAE